MLFVASKRARMIMSLAASDCSNGSVRTVDCRYLTLLPALTPTTTSPTTYVHCSDSSAGRTPSWRPIGKRTQADITKQIRELDNHREEILVTGNGSCIRRWWNSRVWIGRPGRNSRHETNRPRTNCPLARFVGALSLPLVFQPRSSIDDRCRCARSRLSRIVVHRLVDERSRECLPGLPSGDAREC